MAKCRERNCKNKQNKLHIFLSHKLGYESRQRAMCDSCYKKYFNRGKDNYGDD